MNQSYPHQRLEAIATGTVKRRPFAPKVPEQTQENRLNRAAHGAQLNQAIAQIARDWNTRQQQQQGSGAPASASMPLLIRADSSLSRQRDALKSAGLEVVSKVDERHLIVAPVCQDLSGLQATIELFLKEEKGGGKVSGIWEILDGKERLQYLLSPELLAKWEELQAAQTMIVDVGIACMGARSQLPPAPKQHPEETDEHFSRRLERWQQKCDRQRQHWDALQQRRLQELVAFITPYNGRILSDVSGSARQPDSFSCRLQISGAGLKELGVNFPYLFEIIEAPSTSNLAVQVSLDPCGVCLIKGLPTHSFPPNALDEIVETYYDPQGIRVFVLEVQNDIPASPRHMSAWAAAIDRLTVEKDILWIIQIAPGRELPDPAQSLMGLTVCPQTPTEYPGLWNTLKPEVAEGDRSVIETLGTIASAFPAQSALLYRALLVHAADLKQGSVAGGYGSLDGQRAIANPAYRLTWMTWDVQSIKPRQVQVYQVQLPDLIATELKEGEVRVEVTLVYQACPARTGRGHRDYLSTWLDWQTSHKGETPEQFLQRILQEYEMDEEGTADSAQSRFRWAIGTRQRYDRQTGALKCRSRSTGTVQKDWMQVKGAALGSGFCVAVTGHAGWQNSPDAAAAYVLLVSVEAIAPST